MNNTTDQKLAIIDIGSNSIHLLITEKNKFNLLDIIESDKFSIRLAVDVVTHGYIRKKNIEKVIKALSTFKTIYGTHTSRYVCFATHALRSSKNQQLLIAEIYNRLDIKVNVINGLEEARLGFRGVMYWFEETMKSPQKTLTIDVGGGSTEIAIGNQSDLLYSATIKIGVVSLTQKYLDFKKIQPEKAIDVRQNLLARFAPLASEIKKQKITDAVAISGTAKMILEISRSLKGPEEEVFNHFTLADIKLIEQHFVTIKDTFILEERFDIGKKRAEIAYAGIILFGVLTEIFAIEKWQVSPYGPRTGMASEILLGKDSKFFNFTRQEIRKNAIEDAREKFNVDPDYSNITHSLAQNLSNQIYRNFESKNKPASKILLDDLMQGVCKLSDVGKLISHASYHKHSYYILVKHLLLGFSEEERHLIALGVRFSRKKLPSTEKISQFPYLKKNIRLVFYLAGVLRLAKRVQKFSKNDPIHFKIEPKGTKLQCTLNGNNSTTVRTLLHVLEEESEKLDQSIGIKFKFNISEN